MTINVLVSILGPRFSDEESVLFAAVAQWVVLSERGGRMLVDAIGAPAHVAGALAAIDQMGRDPIVIGAWHRDGSPVDGYAINTTAWLAVAPQRIAGHDDQGEPIMADYAEFAEIHRWQGWAPKQIG